MESVINLAFVVGIGYVTIKYVIPELTGGSAPALNLGSLTSLIPSAAAAPAPAPVVKAPKPSVMKPAATAPETIIEEVAEVAPEAAAADEAPKEEKKSSSSSKKKKSGSSSKEEETKYIDTQEIIFTIA